MDKSRLLLTCIIIFFCFSMNIASKSHTCWKKPSCTCFGSNRTTISCGKVQNVGDLVDLFKSRSPVYRIHLKGTFTTIPSKVFENISVSVLWIAAPLKEDIPNDALLDIQNLKIVILNRTLYETVPDAFSNQYYIVFESSHGRLTSISTQLQNMSFAVEIRLNRNYIASISPEAFYGTNGVCRIDLSYNKLVYIDPKTLEPLTFLEAIYLQNNHLQMLDGCFNGLNPEVIDLYANNLTSIDRILHSHMRNLKYLNIGANPEMEVTSHSFNRSLKSLSSLHMSNIGFTKLDHNLLKNLMNLHELYLNGNNLVYLPSYFFENNPFLNILQLSNNRLTTVEDAFRNRKDWYNWIKIQLDGNKLNNIAFGNKPTKILSLDISRNEISYIKEEDIAVLQHVKYLNLSYNCITSIEKDSFDNFYNLQDLDLSYNHLKQLNFSLGGLRKMYKLKLSSTFLEHLSEEDFLETDKLKYLYLRNNSLQTVSGVFKQLKNLGILDLSMNNLTTLTTDSFSPSWNDSMRIRLLWMADNPWTCDCRLAWIVGWIKTRGKKLMDEPICAAPDHLKDQPLRSLNLTDFVSWYDGCPDICECICHWDGNQIYTEARCTQQELTGVPKVLPGNIRILDLSWNSIKSFDSKDLLDFINLEQLNLEHNSIHKVQVSALPPKMSSLRLAYNELHTFPLAEWMVANASLNQISLSHNPWTCNCEAWSFRKWIIKENETIMDANEIRCDKEESVYLRNKLIISLTRAQMCSIFSDIIILSSCLTFLLIFLLLIFCYRHSLRALFYTAGCTCLKNTGKHEYPYDIFLMYSDADEQLALGELAKALENPKYSFNVCIPNRDIPAPRTQQKINAYLPMCAKVLVLLTRSFIENVDCMRFLISAMSFSTASSANCIIFVTKGELPPRYDLDPMLKTLLQSCTRIRWGECLFWQKLIYQLPKKGKRQQQWADSEEEPFLNS